MLKLIKVERLPVYADSVQVTAENMQEIAEWCNGEIRTTSERGSEERYIKVWVQRPLNERQTRAFVGDWVLYASTGFKVYIDAAYKANFKPSKGDPKDHPKDHPVTKTKAASSASPASMPKKSKRHRPRPTNGN